MIRDLLRVLKCTTVLEVGVDAGVLLALASPQRQSGTCDALSNGNITCFPSISTQTQGPPFMYFSLSQQLGLTSAMCRDRVNSAPVRSGRLIGVGRSS